MPEPDAKTNRFYVYRVADQRYARDMTGEGARRFGGRWTRPGHPVMYTAEHPALAGFEKLVHAGVSVTNSPLAYRLVVLELPSDSVERVQHVPDDPLVVGTAWAEAGHFLALQVPSVVVPYATNILVNPRHPRVTDVSIHDDLAFIFDSRIG